MYGCLVASGSPLHGDRAKREQNGGGGEVPTWRAGIRPRDGRCTLGRERALLLGCRPRATLAPQTARGRTRPPRAAWRGWWAQTLALQKGTSVEGESPLCSSSPDSQRGLGLLLPPLYIAFSLGQRTGSLLVLSEQTGPNMQHLSKHMARDNRGICILSEFSWLSPPIFILPLPLSPLAEPSHLHSCVLPSSPQGPRRNSHW